MALEDFEKDLARRKESEDRQKHRRRDRESPDSRRQHHHRPPRRRDSQHEADGHRSKRSKRSRGEEDADEARIHHRHRHRHRDEEGCHRDSEVEPWITRDPRPDATELKRDSWMQAPSALDVDYIQRPQRQPTPPKNGSLGADFVLKLHEKELNHHLRDLQEGKVVKNIAHEGAQHEVDYKFGDAGSQWRMTRLKAVYRQAEESGRELEAVALERYDDLRELDNAREEEIELGRREAYGSSYVGKDQPSGDLYAERKLKAGVESTSRDTRDPSGLDELVDGLPVPIGLASTDSKLFDQTALNRLKAQVMKAKLLKDPNLPDLEKEYNEASQGAVTNRNPDIVTLSAMDNRMLSSAPRNEVKAVQGRRGQERGQVEENEDMSIEDMVREERRTRGQIGGEGERFAERIAKDAKFDNDLDYMDENATKLAKRVHKSEINLRNTAISDFQKTSRILDNCPLCHHEDTNTPPVAPVVSLAMRTYLTLPTEPELCDGGVCIVPTQHRVNLLECDDDEWEEIRNFMKSLTRLYHDQGRDVIFYENAAFPNRKPHAALNVVPLPYSLGETAPAFFKEAFLTSEDEWSQHKKIIDTLAKSKQGLGKLAFRRSLVKEMPYFHVWFELDGGLGHIVEDGMRWPKGDLFAREIIGGMLDLEPDVIKRQGRWHRGHDSRVDVFRKKWTKFDWTRVLTEN